MMRPMKIAGAALAGGRSSRMGQPKEEIQLPDGRTMLEAVVERIERICPVKVISGEASPVSGAVNVEDRIAGLGPLAGIEAILASGIAERYLVAACDQPLISEDVLRRLVSEIDSPIVVPRGEDGFVFPLPGVYDSSILAHVREQIERRELSLFKLHEKVGAHAIDVSDQDAGSLRSFNTPEELAELFKILR